MYKLHVTYKLFNVHIYHYINNDKLKLSNFSVKHMAALLQKNTIYMYIIGRSCDNYVNCINVLNINTYTIAILAAVIFIIQRIF